MSSYATPRGIIAMGISFPVLGAISVTLRFYSRYVQKLPILLDDLFILPATILMIVSCVALIIGVLGKGLGYPTPGLASKNALFFNPIQSILAEKVEFVIVTFQPLTLGFAKLSIIFFYRRVFSDRTSKSDFGSITSVTIALIVLWTIAFFFAWLFSCGIHIDAQWGPVEDLRTKCVNTLMLNEAYAISDFLMDMIIFFLPIYPVWKLRMPLARRIAVLLILMLGAVTIVATIIRMVFVILLVDHIDNSFTTSDEDLIVSTLLYWTVCESGLAIIVACLPTFRIPYFFNKIDFDSILGRLKSRSTNSKPSENFDDTLVRDSQGYSSKTVELKSVISLGKKWPVTKGDIETSSQHTSEYVIFVTNDIVQVEDKVDRTATRSFV